METQTNNTQTVTKVTEKDKEDALVEAVMEQILKIK